MKKKIFVLLSLLSLLLCAACGSGDYSFPATEADMEKLLNELQPDWQLEDSQAGEKSSSYLYSLPEEELHLSASMWEGSQGELGLQLALMDPLSPRYAPVESLETLAPQLFTMAEQLFGQGNRAEEIFAELAKELPAGEWPHFFPCQNSLREGELCYTLNLRWDAGLDYAGLYEFSYLELQDIASYEMRQKFLASTLEAEALTVAELPTPG
ncbi:MAG: hypothetical protein Q4B50_02550, partial [Bacillota bacterium]|nr:hypothetical protein [Bacillota bacterium]